MTLAEAVRSQRAVLRLTQDELAKKIGVARRTIVGLEQGKNTSWETAMAVIATLSIPLDSLSL